MQRQYQLLSERLAGLNRDRQRDALLLRDMHGQTLTIPLSQVRDAWYPNAMNTSEKLAHWGEQVKKFLTDSPREANTEGGVFPAIFGTVLMVILMSIVVMPFGVIAAVYLHEYAGNNLLTRVIRIAVVNLAGVPSIVYGVFGLGFFVYMIGGTLDQLFYPESLPNPTFGTPGVLWAALTLALLTLPVVIVATEEGLSRIPTSLRQGSMALGASRAETLWRIVLPMAAPAMMTGLILAVARAARDGAADAGGGSEIGAGAAGGRDFPVSAPGTEVYAFELPDLRYGIPEPERRGGAAAGVRHRLPAGDDRGEFESGGDGHPPFAEGAVPSMVAVTMTLFLGSA